MDLDFVPLVSTSLWYSLIFAMLRFVSTIALSTSSQGVLLQPKRVNIMILYALGDGGALHH